ncbi:MAG: hypothetical protein WD404_10475 [Solirubrobacterales bacterium]
MAEVVAECGLRGASVARVAQRAGVTPKTFKKQFDDPDDCFLALIDWMLGQASSSMVEALERERSWSDGVLAGLEAMVALLDREPVRARACLLEGMAAPSIKLEARAEALGELSTRVHGRALRELAPDRHPSGAMAEATIGSVLGLLRRRLLTGDAPPFTDLLGELAEVVVTPYQGPEAAARVARDGRERSQAMRVVPTSRSISAGVEVPDLLRRANAHRMRSCMRYLAENPGTSNKAVAAGIDVPHQGQVSRLLARLDDAGLLEKCPGGPGRANAWRLSPRGAEVALALSSA